MPGSSIDVIFHNTRELLASGQILLEKVHISKNAVNMLIKRVISDKFKHYLNLLHVSQCSVDLCTFLIARSRLSCKKSSKNFIFVKVEIVGYDSYYGDYYRYY